MKFRLRAFLLHCMACLCLAGLALLLVFGVWYPAPLQQAVGVTSIFLILLAVDVTLGPMLTLLVAKEGKKTLRSDLTIIVVLQLSAFFYGMYVVSEGRPVWLVFNKDRFDLVRADQLNNSYREKASAEYYRLSFVGPKWVASRAPRDSAARNQLLFESTRGGADLPQRPDLYFPYAEAIDSVRKEAHSLSQLSLYNDVATVKRVLAEWPEADGFLPMKAPMKAMTVLVRKEQGEIIAVVPLKPWP